MAGRKFEFGRDIIGRATVRFDYDPRMVAAIKRLVPSHHRSYNPGTKEWAFSWWYQEDVKQAFIRIEMDDEFAASEGYAHQQRQQARTSASNAPVALVDAFTSLFQLLPAGLAPKARTALVRALHPDTGGDLEAAKALNIAWDRVGEAVAA